MQELGAVRKALAAGELDGALSRLLCRDLTAGRKRVADLLDGFQKSFGVGDDTPITLCSAPGRTEICGNHTDHQHGRVLAAAVDLDFLACAAPNGTNTIRFQSQGWPMVEVELDGQQFLLALPQEVATVLGSRERLWSALENLCYNALSFTHEGGSITLSLEIEPTQAHIQVRDTGVGIAPEQLSQIFQRGFTSRAADGGDGLGLYLVRLIAMEHGGSVQAASQLGSGSTFTITLPLA